MAEVDTFIEDFGNGIEKQDEMTQPMSTPKKYYNLRRKAASLKILRLVKGNQSVSHNLISDQDLI